MKGTVYKYVCACGTIVERARANLKKVACFDCKRKRMNMYYILGHSTDRKLREKNKALAEKARFLLNAKKEVKAKHRREREFKIVEMRLQGKTLEQIAHAMDPQITRERVRQILYRLSLRDGVVIPKKVQVFIETDCFICGKTLKRNQNAFKGHGKHRHQACHRSKFVHEDGTPMDKNEIGRWYYHNQPGRKEKHDVLVRKYHKRKMSEDPAYKERFQKYQREYYHRRKNDPEYRKRIQEYQRSKYQKYMSDPEYREKDRERHRKYYEKRRAEKLSTRGQLPDKGT